MNYQKLSILLLFFGISGCGGGSSDSPHPSVSSNPPSEAPYVQERGPGKSLDPLPQIIAVKGADEMAVLFEQDEVLRYLTPLMSLAINQSPVACSIEFRHLRYQTVDEHAKTVNADGIMMIPRGKSAMCGGPKPTVVYSHGTWPTGNYNLAKMFDDQQPAKMEAMAVAATFASRGYIVIAPNYGGYGESTMSYHPYLNGDLLGKDSADALSAAYSTFNAMNVVANGNVYLTGISEGGYSTMAANKELQQRGQQVKAVVPISSPAAISLLVDQTAHGNISNGGTFFMPLLLNSWQHQSGDIFQNSNEVYATKYANSPDGIPTPFKGMSFQDVVNKKIVPEEQLFPDSSNVPNKSNFFKFSGPDALLSDNFSKDFVADTENNSCDSDFFDKSKEGFPFEPDRIKFQAGGFQLLNAAIISILPSSYSQAAATAIDIIANLKDPSGGSTPAGNVIKNALKLIFPSQADQITNMIGNFTDIVAYEKKPLLSVDHTAATYASIAPKFNCTPKNTFRKAALRNDLRRDWIPPNPMLMCGGGLDPTVPFISSVATIANLRNQGVPSSMADLLDLEVIPSPNSPYARIFGLFKIYEGISFYNDNGATQSSGIKKFLTNYHAGTVSPFCLMAAKMYFDTNN